MNMNFYVAGAKHIKMDLIMLGISGRVDTTFSSIVSRPSKSVTLSSIVSAELQNGSEWLVFGVLARHVCPFGGGGANAAHVAHVSKAAAVPSMVNVLLALS